MPLEYPNLPPNKIVEVRTQTSRNGLTFFIVRFNNYLIREVTETQLQRAAPKLYAKIKSDKRCPNNARCI